MAGHRLELPEGSLTRLGTPGSSVLVDPDGEADPLGQQVPQGDVLDCVVLFLNVVLLRGVVVLLLVSAPKKDTCQLRPLCKQMPTEKRNHVLQILDDLSSTYNQD